MSEVKPPFTNLDHQINFGHFASAYDNPHKRHHLLKEFADSLSDSLASASMLVKNYTNYSRLALATMWGDTMESLREQAEQLYSLKDLATEHEDRTVMVFRRGSPDSVLADEWHVAAPIEVEVGKLASSNLAHGYNARPNSHQPGRYGVVAPLWFYGVGLEIENLQKLTVIEDNGRPVVAEPSADIQVANVWDTTVPLDFDIQRYAQQANKQRRLVVAGNVAAFRFVEQLATALSGEPLNNFIDMSITGELAIGEPLPDLRRVFPQPVPAQETVVSA